MRISSQMFFMSNTTSLMSQQAELSELNLHLSSTKRVMNASDDPVAIATIQRLKQDLAVGEQYISNGETAQSANELSDITLEQSTYILQRVRELMVSGSNGTMNESNREAIALELETLKEELMGVANTQDGNSQYIYAGYDVDTKPFQLNESGEVEYYGDSGERDIQIGSGVTVQANDAGDNVFMNIASGNGTFVSEVGEQNGGSGVVSSGNVVDENKARNFLDQDYAITMSDDGSGPEYSVYGLQADDVGGTANISIQSVAPALGVGTDAVEISFVETGTKQFAIYIDGADSGVSYDASDDRTTQELTIDGITINIDGLPAGGDSYALSQYVEATPYNEDGQSISFNGIQTEIKGSVAGGDSFSLKASDEKSIFATIQSAIDTLRIPGTSDSANATRDTGFSMSLSEIDGALDNITAVRSSVGARLNTIDNQNSSILDLNLLTTSTLSTLEDLDMAAAISEYQQQYSMLEVTQQTFVQLQQLSLFSLI